MPLRVGFDLDGTVADMYFALRREAIAIFGDEVLRKAEPQSTRPQDADSTEKAAEHKVDPDDTVLHE